MEVKVIPVEFNSEKYNLNYKSHIYKNFYKYPSKGFHKSSINISSKLVCIFPDKCKKGKVNICNY